VHVCLCWWFCGQGSTVAAFAISASMTRLYYHYRADMMAFPCRLTCLSADKVQCVWQK